MIGCHFEPKVHNVAWDELPSAERRDRLVLDAESFVQARELRVADRTFPFDCSGLVGAVLYQNGIDVFRGASELQIRGNGVTILHQFYERYGSLYQNPVPGIGDLVFFSNTYDRNRDRHLNDRLTHVGIVETIDSDGTITFIHQVNGGIHRYVMNLKRPHQHQDESGKVLNSYLRRRRRSDGAGTPYLTGSLFAGFGSLERSVANKPLANRS